MSTGNKSLLFRGIIVLLTSRSRRPRTLSVLRQNIEMRIQQLCDILITDLPVSFLFFKSCVTINLNFVDYVTSFIIYVYFFSWVNNI